MKKCIVCGEKHNNKKYCSRKCQYKDYKKSKVERKIIYCINCGVDIEVLVSDDKKYCSRKCCDEHKKIIYVGEKNPMFGKVKTQESKDLHSKITKKLWSDENYKNKVRKSKLEYNQNNEFPFGWKPESKIKRKNTFLERYGTTHNWKDDECRKKINNTCIERYGLSMTEIAHKGLFKKSKTKIEKIIGDFLDEKSIKYKPQFRIYYKLDGKLRYKIYDFMLIDKNIIIEADGDYWHANPNIFNINELNKTQMLNIENDIFKDELSKSNNFNILRFWETNILNGEFKIKLNKCLK